MKMHLLLNHLLLGLILIFLVIPTIMAGPSKPDITVKLEKYDPIPVEPGSVFDVWAGIDNKGVSASNMKIRIVNDFPFAALQEVVNVGTVPESEKILAHFLVKTDMAAQSRDYNLTFEYQWGDNEKWWIQSTTPIQLRASGASVSVPSYTVTPENVAPGSTATLVLIIENNGRTIVKDVDASIDMGEKFSLFGTGTTRRISVLKPGEKVELTYTLVADPSAEPKVYSFPVVLSYSDDRNNKYTRTSIVSVSVNAKPDIIVLVDNVVQQKEHTKVSLKAINKGTVNLKYLTLRLLPGEYTASSDTAYLGNIDSDDFEVVDFLISPKGKSINVPYEATFKDPYNKDFSVKGSVTVTTPEEEQRGTGYWLPLIAGIIGVLIGLVLRKRKR